MNTGEISGNVQDLSRSALPGATIIAQQAGTGLTFTTVANGSGEYLFAQLPVGVYSLSVSATISNSPRCRGWKSTPAIGCGAISPGDRR